MLTAIDLTGTQQEIDAILTLVKQTPGVEETSEPTNLDASRALNVGLPTDPVTLLKFITLVFTTGKAALEFLKALREQLKTQGGAVAVSNAQNGQKLGQLKAETPDGEVSQMIPQ